MTADAKPLARLDERIAKMEAASIDIKAATREAHEAIKTLRLLKKEISRLLGKEIHEIVDAAIAEQVRAGLEEYKFDLNRAQRQAVDQVGRTFDELARVYLGEKFTPEHLPTVMERVRREREGP